MSSGYYKLLNADGRTPQQGFQWPIPNGKSADWLPPIKGKLILCKNAYHVLTISQLLEWTPWTEVLVEVEIGDEKISDDKKTGVRKVRPISLIERWNDSVLCLFAADCAERSLRFYEAEYPNDDRPHLAIEATRDFACGRIDSDALDTARAAARAAAWDAERAAWDAARAAAWAAARAAARAAAWDAARVAARDAAKAAAWDAAWDAARDAAWDAARDAAWDAERQWQLKRLELYLNI